MYIYIIGLTTIFIYADSKYEDLSIKKNFGKKTNQKKPSNFLFYNF